MSYKSLDVVQADQLAVVDIKVDVVNASMAGFVTSSSTEAASINSV